MAVQVVDAANIVSAARSFGQFLVNGNAIGNERIFGNTSAGTAPTVARRLATQSAAASVKA